MMYHVYGMRNRGFSPACQPMDGLVKQIDGKGSKYHDLLVYKRKLTEEEKRAFELDYILSFDQRVVIDR